MVDINKEILKHLDAAISLEEESKSMYSNFFSRATNQYSKDVFSRMVVEEGKHLDFVKKLRMNFASGLAISHEEVEALEALKPGNITAIRNKTKEEAAQNYLSALVTVVEFEERAYTFYRELESTTEKVRLRNIFEILAGFEKEHYDRFKQELESVKNNPYL